MFSIQILGYRDHRLGGHADERLLGPITTLYGPTDPDLWATPRVGPWAHGRGRQLRSRAIEAWILLSIGAFEPVHRFIRLTAKCIYLGDPRRVPVRLLFKHAGKRRIGVGFSSECVI